MGRELPHALARTLLTSHDFSIVTQSCLSQPLRYRILSDNPSMHMLWMFLPQREASRHTVENVKLTTSNDGKETRCVLLV